MQVLIHVATDASNWGIIGNAYVQQRINGFVAISSVHSVACQIVVAVVGGS
jgi:hypothetical protein